MEEVWRDIPGFEGYYQVSNRNHIKSQYNGEHIISPHKVRGDYLQVCLFKDGKRHYLMFHKIVSSAFPEICGKYFEGAEVDHINTIRTDNRPENLRLVSPKTNRNNPLTKNNYSKAMKGNTRGKANGKWVIKLSTNNEILHFTLLQGKPQKKQEYHKVQFLVVVVVNMVSKPLAASSGNMLVKNPGKLFELPGK